MGLIPKRKKKSKPEQASIEAQWKIYNDGENFALIVDGNDISDNVEPFFLDDDEEFMMAWDKNNCVYYYMGDITETEDDTLYKCEAVKAEDHTVLITYNSFENYYFFVDGEHEALNTESAYMFESLVIYSNTYKDFYVIDDTDKLDGFVFVAPKKLNSTTGIIWMKNGEGSYFLNIKGSNRDESLICSRLGDHLLVLDSELQKSFLLKNYDSETPHVQHETDYYDIGSDIFWLKTDDGKYRFYENFKNLVQELDLAACKVGDDVLVYRPDTQVHYLFRNFSNADSTRVYYPEALPNNTDALWIKPGPKKYRIVYQGNEITGETEPRLMDGMLLLPHKNSNILFVCQDFMNCAEGQWAPAVLMNKSDMPM